MGTAVDSTARATIVCSKYAGDYPGDHLQPDPPSETQFVLEDGRWKICEPNGAMMESANEWNC